MMYADPAVAGGGDSKLNYIYMGWGWGSLGLKCWVDWWAVLVIFVLSECFWNAPAVLLVLPTFDVTGSLVSPLHQVVYPSGFMVPP